VGIPLPPSLFTFPISPFLLILALLLPLAASCAEGGIALSHSEYRRVDDFFRLDATYVVTLGATLEEVLGKGVALPFIVEFEVRHPRSLWFDETVAEVQRSARISYNALLRQYLVESGPYRRGFDELAPALAWLGRIEAWPVLDARLVRPRTDYVARLRMRLDTQALPKPLQISVLTSKRWELESSWHVWSFRP
jgi:hypothetical protein